MSERRTQLQFEVADFLYEEARLLDTRAYHKWLDLLTDDFLYWVPIIEGTDPTYETSIIYDDRQRVDERVFRLLETPAHAQSPPSRTQHNVTNVQVAPHGDDELEVHCNLTVNEMRPGDPGQVGLGSPRLFAARCRYLLTVHGSSYRIRSKSCLLIDRDQPIYNLTFLL